MHIPFCTLKLGATCPHNFIVLIFDDLVNFDVDILECAFLIVDFNLGLGLFLGRVGIIAVLGVDLPRLCLKLSYSTLMNG